MTDSLITLTVNATHFYLIDCLGGHLLIDAGWELAQFTAQLKTRKVPLQQIRYVMFTHHHPDHAGLVQAVRDLSGAILIIHEKQLPFLDALNTYARKMGGFPPLRVEKTDLVNPSRAELQAIGVPGELVETPGHSDDSISLVLDSGAAFIGDLPTPDMVDEDSAPVVRHSWQRLLAIGAKVFYHSHAGMIPIERVQMHSE